MGKQRTNFTEALSVMLGLTMIVGSIVLGAKIKCDRSFTRSSNETFRRNLQYDSIPKKDREIIERYSLSGDSELSVEEMSSLFKDYQLSERDTS